MGDRARGRVSDYAEAVRNVARSAAFGVALVDIHAHFGGQDDERVAKFLNTDGLHLGRTGNDEVVSEVLKALQSARPSLLPESLPQDGPRHQAIDVLDWKASIDNAFR